MYYNADATTGGAGGPHSNNVVSPRVLLSGGKFEMFYGGDDGYTASTMYATSDDGVSWTRQGKVDLPDCHGPAAVFKTGETYELYYRCSSARCRATSMPVP